MAVLSCTPMILTDQQIAPIDVAKRRASGFAVGDTVRVHQKIAEKDKTRIQVFEGTVISRKHGTEPGATFTVRRVGTDGIAVEKIFPLYAPTIDRVEVSQKIKTRRAKLYFLRGRTPKQIREKLRNTVASIKDAVLPETQQQEQEEKKEEQPAAQSDKQQEQESKQEDTPKEQEKETPEAQSDAPTPPEADESPEPEQQKQSEAPEQPNTAGA